MGVPFVSGVSIPIKRTRTVCPPITTSMVSPSITRESRAWVSAGGSGVGVSEAVGTAVDAALRVGDGCAGVEAERAGGGVGARRVVPRPSPALGDIVAVEIADTGR